MFGLTRRVAVNRPREIILERTRTSCWISVVTVCIRTGPVTEVRCRQLRTTCSVTRAAYSMRQ